MRQEQLPRWQMILYSSGSLATALSYQAFGTYIQFLYIDVFGLRAAWVGLIWSVYGVWNAINDPLAGYWSDRTQTRFGRRIPWIAGLFLPLSLSFYLLWLPPESVKTGSEKSLLIYFGAMVLIFDLLWTLVVMNWTALFPEMIPDEKQRASVSQWRQIFSLVGLLMGVALPPVLAGEDWSGVGTMALLLSVVTAIFFGLSLFGSRERKEFWHDEPLPLKDALKATAANKDFRYFLGTSLMVEFLFLAMTSNVPFYTKYVLKIQQSLHLAALGIDLDVATQNSVFLGVAFIIALPALPVWTAITRRLGAWRTLRIALGSTTVALMPFFFAWNFYSGVAAVLFFGVNLAGLMLLPDLLVADLVDADELKTGSRREGLYFGMNGFIIRFAFTIQGILTAIVLTVTGYVTPTDGVLYPVQPEATLAGIKWMLAGFPAIGLLFGIYLLGKYSLHGERQQEMKAQVAELHDRKRAAMGEEHSS